MVFCNNFVCVVKVDGKILRERDNNTVYLPFGSEYSLLFKNLDSRRAVVKVEIDGQDVLDGRQLIVEANSAAELERFIKDDLNQGQRFRFIQKTREIAEHRGDRVEDGIIRVEYRFEQPPVVRPDWHGSFWSGGWVKEPVYGAASYRFNVCSSAADLMEAPPMACCAPLESTPAPDEGLTVPGSQSQQAFQQGCIGALETRSQVIAIKLKGYTASKPVTKPLYVKCKLTCPTCGRISESSAAFCYNCGTALL